MYLSIVIFPDSASDLVATQIKSFELDFPNTQLLRSWVLSWLMLHQSLPKTKKTKPHFPKSQKNNLKQQNTEKKVKTKTHPPRLSTCAEEWFCQHCQDPRIESWPLFAIGQEMQGHHRTNQEGTCLCLCLFLKASKECEDFAVISGLKRHRSNW